MFRKLRNKFILTNMLVSTVILAVAFAAIFGFTAIGARREPPRAPNDFGDSQEMREAFEKGMSREREGHVGQLAITLVVVGISVEVSVFVVSYFLAEKSIAPVKEAYIRQREFIANASHELKTPIAAVQANFEALGATKQPWVDNIEAELTRASRLVNDLLALARTDGRTSATPKKDVDVVRVVRNRVKLIEARLGEKELSVELPEKMVANINEADFTQILDILLDNAAKYSNNVVKITTKGRVLTVENDGKTIPVDKMNKLFDRFYQIDKTKEGSGLGLAIAKAVAEQNNWRLWAESDKSGTRFSIGLTA